MTRRPANRPVISDPEVLELLGDKPELLAIADAISATRPPVSRQAKPAHRPFSWRPLAVATAVVACAAIVATVLPLHGSNGGLTAQALAAVSGGQTLHVVMVAPSQGDRVVDLKTGRTAAPQVTMEVWFDETSDRMRVEVRKGTSLQYAGSSRYALDGGMRATLAAHGVSPSLGVFVVGYRDALRRGQVQDLGDGAVGNRQVDWLRVGEGAAAQTVAVDQQTKLPVIVKTGAGASWRLRDVDTETTPVASASTAVVVRHPARQLAAAGEAAAQVSGQVVSSRVASVAQAKTALAQLVAPSHAAGFALAKVSVQMLVVTFSDSHKVHSPGIELRYQGESGHAIVQEAMRPEPAYRYVEADKTFNFDPLPPTGQLALAETPVIHSTAAVWTGQMRLATGLYLTVIGSSEHEVVALAQALAAA